MGKETELPKVTFVYAIDWTGMYVNGELVVENHTISAEEVLRELGYHLEQIVCDEEWLDERGELPEKVEDVKKQDQVP